MRAYELKKFYFSVTPEKLEPSRADFASRQLSGLILVIFEPCIPTPPMSPFWSKMKA
jgi:hypothetical protein